MLAHSAQTILLDSALRLWLARAWELEVASLVSSKQISRRKLVTGFPVVSVVGSVGPHSSCDFAGGGGGSAVGRASVVSVGLCHCSGSVPNQTSRLTGNV